MGKNRTAYTKVGVVDKSTAIIAKLQYDGEILMAPGVKRHIKKRHEKELKPEVINNLEGYIQEIIAAPDYVGFHKKKEGKSIEYIKKFNDNLLVAIEVDLDERYLYIASLYPITDAKIYRKLKDGSLKKLDKN